MKPSQIYYSQNSINEKFDNGYTIYATLNACKNHPFVIYEIPPIRVCKKDGKWYTLDNRRRWEFKRLEEQGHVDSVRIKQVSPSLLTAQKFTTTNGGESVEIRNRTDWFFKSTSWMTDNNSIQCYLLHKIDLRIKRRVTEFQMIY